MNRPAATRSRLILTTVAALVLVMLTAVAGYLARTASVPDQATPGPGVSRDAGPGAGAGPTVAATPVSGLPTVPLRQLPTEAVTLMALIDRGGPFAYSKDGTVFGNLEGRLPKHERGYYHEYTVPTPGSPDRGARRIVVGRAGDVYYTGDHYDTFRQVLR